MKCGILFSGKNKKKIFQVVVHLIFYLHAKPLNVFENVSNSMLSLVLLNPDIPCLCKSVDPDQLTSEAN